MDRLNILATLPLQGLDSLHQARSKVYNVGWHLAGSSDIAVRMASEFSDLGRQLLSEQRLSHVRFSVNETLDTIEFHIDYCLDECPAAQPLLDSSPPIPEAIRTSGGWELRKIHVFPRLPRGSFESAKAAEILQAKSRGELFNDLNLKNELLQIEIEERKATEESLRQAQQELIASEKLAALGGLVAGIAHEINTPVGIGVTAASHLSESIREFELLYRGGTMRRSDLEAFLASVRELNGMVEENLNRASRLIRSFKEVAVDQTADDEREINLRDYIEQVVTSLSPRLRNRPIEIVTEDIDPTLQLKTSPGPISQIFTNFIMNSLIHGFQQDQRGRIRISAKKSEAGLEMLYSDDGNGIAPEHLKKIFDPFFTTKRSHGGSGLGMHLIYNIVTKKYSGQIRCESELGKGVLFRMTFPDMTCI